MSLLLTFAMTMFVTSGIIWLAASLFYRFNPKAGHWSLLWAAGMLLSVLIPCLGLAARLLPDWARVHVTDPLIQHMPLPPLALTGSGPIGDMSGLTAFPWDLMVIGAVALYAAGAVLRLSILGVGRWQLRRIIRRAEPTGQADGVIVLRSDLTRSAFAWTPFGQAARSRIIIPTLYWDEMSDQQIADIITHERQHIRRGDDQTGLILRGLLCLCWISPFAHSLFGRWSQAAEIQCDMAVTDGRSPRMRRAYAETLLQALHIMAGRVRQYPACAFSTPRLRNNLRTEKMRMTHIMKGSRPAFKRGRDRLSLAVSATCLTLAGTLCMAVTAQADAPDTHVTAQVSSAIVSGRLTAPFGKSYDPFRNGEARIHKGVDIAAPLGTPVYAPAAGTIQAATDLYDGKPGYGTVVVMETEGGVRTLFSHLDGYSVRAGDRVAAGQQIATVGSSGRSTGPHVHIETFRNDVRVDPLTVWDLVVD